MKKIVSTISAGVMMFCFGARAPATWRSAALRIGNADHDQQQRHQRADRAAHDQRAMAADRRNQRRHDGRRDRAAEEAGKGVDRKGAAHPRLVHMGRQDRVIGRMIDAVGEPEQHGAGDQPGIAQMQAEHDQRAAAEGEADQQDFAGADMVGEIADRRLGQAGDHGEDGQGKAKLDIADAELRLSGTGTASAARTYGNG